MPVHIAGVAAGAVALAVVMPLFKLSDFGTGGNRPTDGLLTASVLPDAIGWQEMTGQR